MFRLHPAQTLVLGFAGLIMAGALLLMLPIATQDGQGLGFVDALFTATSAVCVTGLVVVDTGSTFTKFGQILLLFLIQMGGWGVLTSGALMFILAGKKIGLRDRLLLQSSLNLISIQGVIRLIQRIVVLTLIIELVGAVFLTLRWAQEMPFAQAVYRGVFYSISSFNNAGFSLRPDSLTPWANDPVIISVITTLFMIGGLGFTVVLDLLDKRSFRKLSLHSKLTISMTLALSLFGMIMIFLLEFRNPHTLAPLSWDHKFWASFFHGMVPRSSGFNSIDMTQILIPTQVVVMGLMFIGASSASTGGGIKVTTFSLMILALWSVLMNREHVHVFRRSIPWSLITKAFAIVVSGILFVFFFFFLLTITEDAPFSMILFETISAFGTVGLSVGLTPNLTPEGRVLITILMFIGRLGPLTMAFALLSKGNKKGGYFRYAEEKVLIG
ncbi:TrkH family potassium uptake protein [Brevibacillus dissolubilis]|uniref:TrkH family potassium uptake protein n=1 Tax=Brevibacillus dissolubilis TaxID=1844116 RepID=UPI002100436E|nr:TrkH family potassium uptake protein [Brevibacillus dissolubilis]